MSGDWNSTAHTENSLWPRGLFAWLMASAAVALAVLMGLLAFWMASPVRWDGPGIVGAAVLFFPLHLLIVSLAAGLSAFVARRRRAGLAAWVFGIVVILTAVMALTPTIAIWQRARTLSVPLSLGNYVANAGHLNLGYPQKDRSVVYGTSGDGTKLELDVWRSGRPDSGPMRPAVVMIHGGAWNHGNRSMMPDWNIWLNGLGYEVFDVEYRMPPPVRWLDEIGDVKSALGWVAAHSAEYHVDPARISTMGSSAGGNLAMLAAYSSADLQLLPSTPVPAVAVHSAINFYGPTELSLLYRTCKSPNYLRPLVQQYIGGAPEQFPERYRLLSPLTHIGANCPPTLTFLGTSDRLVSVEQALLLDRALSEAGVPHETYLLPGSDHAFDCNWGGFATQIARAKIKNFLDRY